jgi:hypothetical protein
MGTGCVVWQPGGTRGWRQSVGVVMQRAEAVYEVALDSSASKLWECAEDFVAALEAGRRNANRQAARRRTVRAYSTA